MTLPPTIPSVQDRPALPERIGPVVIRARLSDSADAEVFDGRTPDGERATVWRWEAADLDGDALPELTRILDALDADGLPIALPRVVHGALDPDGAVVAFERPAGERLPERLRRDTASPVEALRGAASLLEGLVEAEARGVAIGRWDPRTILSLHDAPAWAFLGPGVHGLAPVSRRPILNDIHEAAACPPEIGTGALRPDRATPAQRIAAEAYALGTTLFYALTGELPFREQDPSAYLRRQLGADARPLPEVDPVLDRFRLLVDLVARCLERAPGQRPQSYQELREAIGSATREAERLDSDVAFLPVRVHDTMEMRRVRLHQPPADTPQRAPSKVVQIGALVVLVAILLFLLLRQTSARGLSVEAVDEAPDPAVTAAEAPSEPD